MEKPSFDILHQNKNYNIETTVKYAGESFAQADLAVMIRNGGLTAVDGGFTVRFIDSQLRVAHPSGAVTRVDNGAAVPDIVKILLLHYAVQAEDVPLAPTKISYKELPGGDIYIEPFTNRCLRPLAGIFGDDPALLQKAVAKTEYVTETYGDFSCTVQVLPKVPLTLIVYQGDDEFPANANILFNGAAASFLPTEDYTQLSSYLISTLKKIAFQA